MQLAYSLSNFLSRKITAPIESWEIYGISFSITIINKVPTASPELSYIGCHGKSTRKFAECIQNSVDGNLLHSACNGYLKHKLLLLWLSYVIIKLDLNLDREWCLQFYKDETNGSIPSKITHNGHSGLTSNTTNLEVVDDCRMSESSSGLEKISTVDWLSINIHALGVFSIFPLFWCNENSRSLSSLLSSPATSLKIKFPMFTWLGPDCMAAVGVSGFSPVAGIGTGTGHS